MLRYTKSRCQWLTAKTLLILIIGSALFWLNPTALSETFRQSDGVLKRTTPNLTSATRTQATLTSRPPVPHPTSTPPTRVEVALTRRIERYLDSRRSPITGIPGFVRDAHLLGINPVAIIAIAEVESSLGKAACRGTKIATGLGACFRAWSVISLCGKRYSLHAVHTWRQGLTLTARLIRCLWPRSTTVHQLYGYCSGCAPWSGAVASVMRRMGSGPGIRWAHAKESIR